MATNSTINSLKESLNRIGTKLSEIKAGTISSAAISGATEFNIGYQDVYIPTNSYFANGGKLTVQSASGYSLNITNKGSTTVTIGSENTNSSGSGYYPITASLTGTLSASTNGWFSSGSATDSSVVVGRIKKATCTYSNIVTESSNNSGISITHTAGYISSGTKYVKDIKVPSGKTLSISSNSGIINFSNNVKMDKNNIYLNNELIISDGYLSDNVSAGTTQRYRDYLQYLKGNNLQLTSFKSEKIGRWNWGSEIGIQTSLGITVKETDDIRPIQLGDFFNTAYLQSFVEGDQMSYGYFYNCDEFEIELKNSFDNSYDTYHTDSNDNYIYICFDDDDVFEGMQQTSPNSCTTIAVNPSTDRVIGLKINLKGIHPSELQAGKYILKRDSFCKTGRADDSEYYLEVDSFKSDWYIERPKDLVWKGTQTEYNNLPFKESSNIYWIV